MDDKLETRPEVSKKTDDVSASPKRFFFSPHHLSSQFTVFIFIILLINTSIAVGVAGKHFKKEYFTLMESRVETVGTNLRSFMLDIMSYGLPLGSLEGIDKELETAVKGDLNAVYANVVNDESEIIYSYPEVEGKSVFNPDVLLPLISGNSRATILIDGSYNTFIPLTDPSGKNVLGGINIGISEAQVLKKTLTIIYILIAIFSVFMCVTTLLLYVVTKRAIKPLEVLNDGALALGDGDLSVRVDVKASNEIGSLAKSFNIMADKIAQDNRKMKQYTITLEERNKKLQDAQEHILQREEKLKNAQTNLVQSEKMASLGVLISGIAHEINTPAGAVANVATDLRSKVKVIIDGLLKFQELSKQEISLFGKLAEEFVQDKDVTDRGTQWKKSRTLRKWLKEEDLEDVKNISTVLAKYDLVDHDHLKQYLQILQSPWQIETLDAIGTVNVGMQICESSIQKITQIVKALKYYAYTDMDQTSLIDLNESIENALLLLHNKLKYSTNVVKEYGNIPQIHCNSEINQVWTNLIGNAYDATVEAGDEVEGKITVTTELVDDIIFIKINDNGTGIKDTDKAKMFDPFYTTKGIGKGTGLGLSIVSGIIKKHEGTIEVESEPGNTTFTVKLPVERRRVERTDDDQGETVNDKNTQAVTPDE